MPNIYKRKIAIRQATLTRYKNGNHTIKIQFPFNPEDVGLVKTLPGRKFHSNGKIWTCPPSRKALKMLSSWAFVIDRKLVHYIENIDKHDVITSIPGLRKKLFPYQMKGVEFLEGNNGRGLIGDEQGLGKTAQSLGYLQLHPELRPVVIIVPASIKLNWVKEIRMWMNGPHTVEVLSGKSPHHITGNIIIINYDILNAWVSTLKEISPKVLIVDEIQYCKSGKTLRTKALKKLARGVPHVIALSGTPIVNRPIEFYNAIQLINSDTFPNWWEFTRRYCGAKHTGFGWDMSGATNTEELHELLSETIMLRRTKSEVLPELPDKIRSFFPLEMHPDIEAEYYEAEDNFLHWMETRRGKAAADRASAAEALAEIEVLKQVAVAAKLPHAMDWIKDFLDSGEKLVVFATHKFVIEALMKQFGKVAVKIDGSVSSTKRQLAVDKFQNEAKTRLFVGNIQAAGVGITLTAASNVAFLELPWTPGALEQASDRVHRIGQKNTVNIYYLLAEFTIEEKIATLLDEKRKVLDSVLDGVQTDDSSLLMDLIENY